MHPMEFSGSSYSGFSEGASGRIQEKQKKNTEAQQNYCSPPRSMHIVGRLYHHLAHVSGGMEGS